MGMENYSVLTTVYIKDTAEALKESIESMLSQTVLTNDYVIVADGPVTQEIKELINSYKEKYSFINFIHLSKNQGLGLALNEGLKHCKNDLVARLDADDISLPERCELQLKEFEKAPDLAIVGSDMYEFEDNPENITSIKVMPHTYEEIYKYGKRRNAFNHSSVMYKKSIVAKCGNYSAKKRSQDVELFSTILANKYKCININIPLIKYRSDNSQIKRRQGFEDIRSDIRVYYNNYKIGYSNTIDFFYVFFTHIIFFLLPTCLADFLFKKFFRKYVAYNNALKNKESCQVISKNNDNKIIYIWFGKFVNENGELYDNPVKALNDRGINLSNEYIIEFERDKDNNPKYNIKRNLDYDKAERNFYKVFRTENTNANNEYVLSDVKSDVNVDLTCVVGKNGSGKTLLLEYLKEVLNRKQDLKSTKKLQYVIIWSDSKEKALKYICSESLNNIPEDKLFCGTECKKSEICNLLNNVIFYSAYLNDLKQTEFDSNFYNIFDLSTEYLLEKEAENITHKPYSNKYDFKQDKLDLFKISEIRRRILFYSNNYNKEFLRKNFENNSLDREYYQIEPSSRYFHMYEKRLGEYLLELNESGKIELHNFITESKDYIESNIENYKGVERVLWLFVKELWIICLHFATSDFEIKKSRENIKTNCINFNRDESKSPELFISNNFKKLLDYLNQIRLDEVNFLKELSKNCLIKLKDFSEKAIIDRVKIKIYLNENYKHVVDSFIEFLNLYNILVRRLHNSNFAEFNFYPRYSTGESGLITLYARLYELFEIDKEKDIYKDYNANVYACKNILLMLDEGETGYHPEWSKQYVYAVLNYIQELIGRIKHASELTNIQIILTTNSPIILSDILPQNVVQLDNENPNSKCKLAFGANILDLYSEPFFINTGLIGRFAQEKINKVLKYVNGYTNEEINYQFIIDSIGDQNIRTFLQNLYSEKIRKEVR